MAQIPNYGQPFAPGGWDGDPLSRPPGEEERPGTFFARLLDPALFGQYATEPRPPPPGQWLAWLLEPTGLAQRASGIPNAPAALPRNPVLARSGSVPLSHNAASREPRIVWRGGLLPTSQDEYGNFNWFDSDSGKIGALKRIVSMPYRVWNGEVDPNSDEAFEAAMDTSGMAGIGPARSARKAVNSLKRLESRNPRIYDPPTLQPRSFDKDYPHGARADEAGNLTQDIEGRPLVAQHIVGRRVVGGTDEALSPTEYVAVTERSIGSTPEAIASREIGGDAGQYSRAVDRRSRNVVSRQILIDRSLPASQANRVLAHEMAHAIDDVAGYMTAKGLNDELRAVYNTLNNPAQSPRAKPMGPEHFGYKGSDVPRELIAEAIRAYMADPNYLKTVAPKTAAAIRAAVNNDPRLKRIIQFNTGGVPVPGTPMSDEEFQQAYWAGNAT